MSGIYTLPLYSGMKTSVAAAVAAHAVFFMFGSSVFTQPAEYGVETGLGGIEVHLTAAPAYVEPVPAPAEPAQKPEETVVVEKVPEVRGDGSLPVPGLDATTLHTLGGAITQAKPNYLKNPAPRYPEPSRRSGEEGLVLLSVRIAPDGRSEDIRVQESSGYPLLDEAALEAVRRWKFKPARVGSMAVYSQVEIPIRFELEERS